MARTEAKRLLQLKEWTPREVELDAEELAELQTLRAAKLLITPSLEPGRYVVQPQRVIGSTTTRRLQIVIEPKIGIDRVFYLLGFARRIPLLREAAAFDTRADILEAFVLSFLAVLQRVMRRGLLLGYVEREEALSTIRGRVRFADQIRRRYSLPLPVEVRYDDYTADTEANRLIKAALRRLSYVRFSRPETRSRVNGALAGFTAVTDVRFDTRAMPVFTYSRLTERYRAPLELARLVLTNVSIELEAGESVASGVLFNMDDVFEDFVYEAVGRELRAITPPQFKWRHGRTITLDEEAELQPEPDLSLWQGTRCVFVGDAKYKTTKRGEVGDLYQLLAYCVATGLPRGLLVYAEAPVPVLHQVVRGGPSLHVTTLDPTMPTDELRARCRELAEQVAEFAGITG